jgi:glycosyltransferase involved in cell wall biosynthesis
VRVSFVIPTRNQAPFVARCIESCLAQTVPDSEILVLDGASTDGTQAILASFGDRIWWTSQPDGGQGDAVNNGIGRARGDVIAWINSDDRYADGSVLADVLAAFASDPRCDVVYGDGLTVDAADRPLRPYRTRDIRAPRDVLLHPSSPVLQPATFFRRQLFADVGGIRTDLRYALDYELWLRMFPRARAIRHLRRPLAVATYHPAAKSISGMIEQIRETVAVKREHQARFALGPGDRLRLEVGSASLYAYWAAVRLGLKRAA